MICCAGPRANIESQKRAIETGLQMQNLHGKNRSSLQPGVFTRLVLGFLLLSLSATLCAQPASDSVASESALPNAPGWEESPLPQSPGSQSTASIAGTVYDINGGIVPTATITLETSNGQVVRVATADSTGAFIFKNVAAGTYKIKITATDLEPFESYEIILHPRDNYQLPMIALPIAKAHIDVTVTVTEEEIAQEQVNAQIQQRVFGVFPNFYTSFLWNAAPINPNANAARPR